jgi:glucan-binding YG repeat protein
MKKMKKGIFLAFVLASVTLLSGCSVKETWDILWGSDKENDADKPEEKKEEDPNAIEVDDSIEAPTFKADLKGSSTYAVGDKAKELKVEAEVKGEGKITYQWYVNTVDSNGGGTQVEGATSNKYTPDTSKDGYYYYFVVATNTIDQKKNLATSKITEVHIDPELEPAPEEGELKKGWGKDKNGWYFVDNDGNKVINKAQKIEKVTYLFDKKGYLKTGWQQIKEKWYYYSKEAKLVTGFYEEDGKRYFLGKNGAMVTGWVESGKYWLYADDKGVIQVDEWVQVDGAWYYFNNDGIMVTNEEVDGKWLNPDGKLAE